MCVCRILVLYQAYKSPGPHADSPVTDSMQLADELPMIYTTCIMAFATFSYSRPRRLTVLIGVGLAALAAFITVYYHLSQNPVFHQVAYASLTCAVVFRGMYVMEAHLRPALKERSESPAHAEQIMKQMWSMATTGIVLFLVGFFIWNMDNIYCGHLRSLRSSVLLPWAVIFEGHGWWHIFTGLGAYYFIIWRVWLTRCLDGSEREFMLHWPSPFTSVPKVVPRFGPTKANGVNGSHKKAL